jgi:hypothetical protein
VPGDTFGKPCRREKAEEEGIHREGRGDSLLLVLHLLGPVTLDAQEICVNPQPPLDIAAGQIDLAVHRDPAWVHTNAKSTTETRGAVRAAEHRERSATHGERCCIEPGDMAQAVSSLRCRPVPIGLLHACRRDFRLLDAKHG